MEQIEKRWPGFLLLLFSLGTSLNLFFLNHHLAGAFESGDKNIEWYAVFSKNIFQPTTSYIAESILLPLAAKLIGANDSTQSYRLFCALITISMLPVLAGTAQCFFNHATKAFLLVLGFAVSFTYLSNYQLGFPDPLTISLLMFTALQRRPLYLFLGASLAGLSHFSMSVVALTAVSMLWISLPETSKKARIQMLKSAWCGLIMSRLLLALWFNLFEYKLTTRSDIVFQSSWSLFITRYNQSASAFWLTPGILFLTSYFLIVIYFALKQKTSFALSLIAALSLAYVAHFFTFDGLRVFAVVISCAYALMMATFIETIYPLLVARANYLTPYLSNATQTLTSQKLYIGLGFPTSAVWLFFVSNAADKGLFINELPLVHLRVLDTRLLDYALVAASLLILITAVVPRLRANSLTVFATKIIFWTPVMIIGSQYLRQLLYPNVSFAIWTKVAILTTAMIVVALISKIELSNVVRLVCHNHRSNLLDSLNNLSRQYMVWQKNRLTRKHHQSQRLSKR